MVKECNFFDTCDAPLCPLDEKSLRNGIWYPGESICKKKHLPEWAKRQKKISKKVREKNKYFTVEMLKHRTRITVALQGLDPDESYKSQLEKWFKKYKGYSENTRKRWAKNLEK